MQDGEYTLKDVMDKMTVLEAKIDPIWEVYSDLQGTKRVLKGVLVTLSLVLGFFASLGELLHIYKHSK